MGHIERGIGAEEQQQEEEKKWKSRGKRLNPVDNSTLTGVREGVGVNILTKYNIHAHRGTYRIEMVLFSQGCACCGITFIFMSCHKLQVYRYFCASRI